MSLYFYGTHFMFSNMDKANKEKKRMKKEDVISGMKKDCLVAVIRAKDKVQGEKLVDAIIAGGIHFIEITMTMDKGNPVEFISRMSEKYADDDRVVIGAGTVLDPETARAVILAGANYVVSPGLNTDTIKLCNRYRVPCLPGVMTPTEAIAALEAGCDIIKVFPGNILGPASIPSVKTGSNPSVNADSNPTAKADSALTNNMMFTDHWEPLHIYEPLDEEKIKASEQLTEEQKRKLIKANRESQIHFDTIKEITKANDEIFAKVMEGSEQEYDELERIYEKHNDIRSKWEQEEIENANTDSETEDENERIKKSKVLSDEEKSILIADNEESEIYQKKIDARYALYNEKSAENNEKYHAAYMAIEKIYADNQVNVNEIPYDIIVPQTENFR